MSITLNTLAYVPDLAINANRQPYVGPSHTFTEKDLLILGRVLPKPTSTSRGKARSQVKRIRTVTLDDSSVDDIIVEVNISRPVGASSTDVDALLNDVGDYLITSGASDLANKGDLTE
jgi:hypothetical protein